MPPVAYVLSDYPILSSGIRRSLEEHYVVVDLTWEQRGEHPLGDAAMIVLDVTGVSADTVLEFVSRLQSRVRIVVSTLDRNEVDVYLVNPGGMVKQQELPGLNSLIA